jgi:hypothetical protein
MVTTHLSYAANDGLQDAVIEKPFKQIFLASPDLIAAEATRVIKIDSDRLAIIGISRVACRVEDRRDLVRIGAIQARANILKFSHGVEVSTYRGADETTSMTGKTFQFMSMSTFFQVTEERAAGKIKQLPVIGSWWTEDKNAFYVAVGIIRKLDTSGENSQILENEKLASLSEKKSFIHITGQAPFVSLLHAFPALRDNGGVRIFSMNNQKKGIIAVASATIASSMAQAEKIARIKAVNKLLAHKNGVQLFSVEYLADREQIRISDKETSCAILSNFLSIQEESVSGLINALPVVARWMVPDKKKLYVSIGKVF